MTRLLLIISFFGLTNFSNGQTIEDKQTVIQMSIDLIDLQQYFHVDKDDPLIILDDGIVPIDLKLIKFGEPVQFLEKPDLFFRNEKAYLDFDKFEISPDHAYVIFHYDIEGLTINLTFEKLDNNWTIKTKKLTEE